MNLRIVFFASSKIATDCFEIMAKTNGGTRVGTILLPLTFISAAVLAESPKDGPIVYPTNTFGSHLPSDQVALGSSPTKIFQSFLVGGP